MNDPAALIADLSRRLEELEDERAVRNVITRYCFAVDAEDVDATEALYWEDCEVSVDNRIFHRGSKEVRNIVTGRMHQSILPNCSHIFAPFLVEMRGSRAIATGYANVIVRKPDGAGHYIWRQSYNRFEMEKRGGVWKVHRRLSISAGSAEAQATLKQALRGE